MQNGVILLKKPLSNSPNFQITNFKKNFANTLPDSKKTFDYGMVDAHVIQKQ